MLYTETEFGGVGDLDVPQEFREPTDSELNDIQDHTDDFDLYPDDFEE